MKNDELTVRTPLGELVVGIKADPDYPGISVAFCGNGMNDCFNEGSIRLAWIEYSPEKHRLQAIVYSAVQRNGVSKVGGLRLLQVQYCCSSCLPLHGLCRSSKER